MYFRIKTTIYLFLYKFIWKKNIDISLNNKSYGFRKNKVKAIDYKLKLLTREI